MSNLPENIANKILSDSALESLIKAYRKAGHSIVFTNGCFDLLHLGHLSLLSAAAELGDKLIVGLNSDDSVKRIKGEKRPVNNELSRAAILASFFFVDHVILFEEDTPAKLIQLLSPDILVKGGDYKISEIVGADSVLARGGEVITIPVLEGFSSSSIIDNFKSL